jgi:hypothetical protein
MTKMTGLEKNLTKLIKKIKKSKVLYKKIVKNKIFFLSKIVIVLFPPA